MKHRQEGEYRDVPATPEVLEALRIHLERGYGNEERTWLSSTGRGHLDWGNITDTYWHPALRKVYSGTAKESLVIAAPKILRKAAITWWFQVGVSPTVAADWAGHTEEVMQMYYASRSSTTWAVEAELLRARDLLEKKKRDVRVGCSAASEGSAVWQCDALERGGRSGRPSPHTTCPCAGLMEVARPIRVSCPSKPERPVHD